MILFSWHTFWPILSAVLYAMNFCIAIYSTVAMILRRQNPVKTLSWIAVMILLPYLGILLYFTFGQNFRKKKLFSRKGLADIKVRKDLCADQSLELDSAPEFLTGDMKPFKKLIYQNLKNSYSLVDFNNDIEFYYNGRDALNAMYASIQGAENHIHLQTYILENDRIGNKFISLLMEKAKSGVEVRLMYDDVGSPKISRKLRRQMENAGIEVMVFSPVHLFMPMSKINYRNHRKILVVDGDTGFLGGVNIADRYYYGMNGGLWHDTQVKITGESVFSLQASFMLDRYFVVQHKMFLSRRYFPHIKVGKKVLSGKNSNVYSQIISSGPDSDWAGIMQCYFTAITSATDHIYIVTPYFTPNETILDAIKVAALGRIDVRLMIPYKGDSQMAHYCTRSYITELLEAGVKVYLFKDGFNHSKVISVDSKMAIIGSANMDERSFEHNFEIMSVMYDRGCASSVEARFVRDISLCEEVSLDSWKKRSKVQKVKESFFRLLSPLI